MLRSGRLNIHYSTFFITAILERVRLADEIGVQVQYLNHGQQQQLAIARALVCESKVILLDEPTEGIQPNIIEKIGEVLRTLVSERM